MSRFWPLTSSIAIILTAIATTVVGVVDKAIAHPFRDVSSAKSLPYRFDTSSMAEPIAQPQGFNLSQIYQNASFENSLTDDLSAPSPLQGQTATTFLDVESYTNAINEFEQQTLDGLLHPPVIMPVSVQQAPQAPTPLDVNPVRSSSNGNSFGPILPVVPIANHGTDEEAVVGDWVSENITTQNVSREGEREGESSIDPVTNNAVSDDEAGDSSTQDNSAIDQLRSDSAIEGHSLGESSGLNSGIDPELGILRIRPVAGSDATVIDPELGILRLRALPPPQPRYRPVSFIANVGIWGGDNLLARSDDLGDSTIQLALGFRAVPRIGRRTFLIGSAEVTNLRYLDNDQFNYNELEFRFGVYHYFNRRTYADLHWRNQQFFTEEEGDRFLRTHQLRFALGRIDPLTPDLTLNSSYQFQSNWADPSERDRLINRFNLGFSQEINDQLTAALSYQLFLSDFTRQDRYDSYHQLLAQLSYNFSDTTTLSVYGGGRWGDSTNTLVDFNSTLFGVNFAVNVPLF